jgi:tRNA (cmo5U34)-methyltransferase
MRQWSQKDYTQKYLETADIVVVGRRESLEILKSFYRHCVAKGSPTRILDLGCGDGVLTRELLSVDSTIAATLVDGSEDMLHQARKRLPHNKNCNFIKATFQELIAGKFNLPKVNFAVSSLAIHHLTFEEKKLLFYFILSHLTEGGHFVNIDTVRSPTDTIEQWYLDLWKEGVRDNQLSPDCEAKFQEMLEAYVEAEHYSKIDTLQDQIDIMKEAGFKNTECFYKRGMFAMYSGSK